jgi:hypothetical protein
MKSGNIKVQVLSGIQGTARREGGWENFKLANVVRAVFQDGLTLVVTTAPLSHRAPS